MATRKDVVAKPDEDTHPVLRLIMSDETYQQEDGDAFSVASRLMLAESPEELLSEQGELTHAGDLLGKPMLLKGVSFREGDANPEQPVYALLTVEVDGAEDIISCGGLNVMVAAKVLKDRGWLPRMVVIKQRAKATKAGYYPLNLLSVEEAQKSGDAPHVVDGEAF